MHKISFLIAVAFALLVQAAAQAQGPTPGSTGAQVIRQQVADYCAAFDKGDIDSVLAFWADDADYIDENGDSHRGKQAIGALFRDSAENLKGYQLGLKIDALRLIRPEVAIEDGVATLTDPEGQTSSSRYTAVWVKSGDRWQISSARELPSDSEPDAASNADYLEPLEWLIGEWTSEDEGPKVNLVCKWALDKNFLAQNYTVTGRDGADLQVTQWIGFDPVTGQIKSWTFDSVGGYGEALWTRDGNTWQADASGVLPGGGIGTALNSLRFVDDTHMEWESTGRNVEGLPMPDAKVKFIRSHSGQ